MTTAVCDDNDIPVWLSLQCHPLYQHSGSVAVCAAVSHAAGSLLLHYRVAGEVSSLNVPGRKLPERADNLWQHTCAELFAGVEHAEAYCEFNFAPSLQWAAYQFAGYRKDLRTLSCSAPVIEMKHEDQVLEWRVELVLPWSCRQAPLQLGLSMVVEDMAGSCSYWALRHDTSRPDFHRRENWICRIESFA